MEFRHDCFWIVRILRIVVSNRKLINPYFITQKHNWHDLSVWEKNASSSGISWSQDFLGQLSEGVRYTWNPNDPCFDWNFGLVLGGWPSQIEVMWVPGIYIRPKVPHLRNAKVPSYSPYLWNPSQRKPRKLWVRVSATVCFIREAGQNNAPIGCKRAPS